MIQIIALFSFLLSLSGICYILYKKIPFLAELPKDGKVDFKKPKQIVIIEEWAKNYYNFVFVKQVPLHKALSKLRVFTLKMESRVDKVLQNLRKRVQELDEKAKKRKPK